MVETVAPILTSGLTAIMLFFLVLNSVQAGLLLLAIPELWSHWRLSDAEYVRGLVGNDALPAVSVVTTTHNAGSAVIECVERLLTLDYPRHEVILVNDGSTDDTMAHLARAYDLYEVPPAFTVSMSTQPVRAYYRSRSTPRLLCIDKAHGGAGDAINAGLNAARYPYTLVLSGDVMVERDALHWLTRPFVLNSHVAVVAPTTGVGNGGRWNDGRFTPVVPKRWWFGMHAVEYTRAFVFERLGWNRIASNLVFPASAALFKHDHLISIGGFRTDSEAPAIDIAVRLYRYLTDRAYNPLFLVIPDAVAWRDLPDSRDGMTAVRGHRQRGTLQTLRAHLGLLFNPEYGMFGVVVLPVVWLTYVIAPFLELAGYIGLIIGCILGLLDGPFVWTYLAAVVGYGMLLSVWTVILEALTFRRYARRADLLRFALYAVAESFGYRQLIAWLRVRAFFVDSSLRRPYGQHQSPTTA